MPTEVGSAYVTLIPSAKGFASKMQSELGGDLARYGQQGGDTYGRSFTDSGKRTIGSRVKGMFGSVAKVGALGLAAAGAVAGKVIGDAIGEAREAAVVGARTDNVIKRMGASSWTSSKAISDLAGSISNKAGVDDEAIQSGENLLLTFGNVRNEAGKGNDIFNQTTGLMVDMSQAMGTDVKGAAIQLGKALNDPTKGMSALSRVGVSFTAQQQEQIKALQESGDTLGAQKIILGEVKKQFGGAAAAMATPADRAKVAWGNFQEQIGTALLPLVDKVLTALADGLPKVAAFGQRLWNSIAPVVTGLLGPIRQFYDALTGKGGGGGDMGQIATTVQQVFGQVQVILAEVVRFIQAKVVPGVLRIAEAWRGFAAAVLPIVRQVVTVLIQKFHEVEPQLRQVWASVQSIITSAMVIIRRVIEIGTAILTKVWDMFGSTILRYLGNAFTNIVQVIRGAFQIIQGIFKVVSSLLTGDWKGAWEGIKTILRGAWNVVVGIVRQGWNLISTLFRAAGILLKNILRKAWDGLKALVRLGVQALIAYVRNLPRMWLTVLSGIGRLLGNLLGKAWDTAKSAVTHGIESVVDLVRSLPSRLLALGGKFLDAGRSIIGKFVDGISNAAGVVGGIAGNVWDAVRGLINGAISKLNSALEFTISLPGPDVHINPPDISPLATGGRVTGATLALIGEGREPETVLPDSLLRGLLERVHASGAASGGVGLLTITNWREGTGYFRVLADDARASEARYRQHLGGMNA